jgi:hypothetical protein
VIIAISVLAYLIAGIAYGVLVVLNEGEPPVKDQWVLLIIALLWPVCAMIDVPIWIARWIRARQAARREKPKVFEEYEP